MTYRPWPKNKHLKQLGTVMTFTLETGFQVIKHCQHVITIIGLYLTNYNQQAYGLAVITNTSKMTREEHDQLCKAAFDDVRSKKVHGYMHQ